MKTHNASPITHKTLLVTRILLVFGTRPEAIKMAPLVKEFQKYPDIFDTKVCVTAQHREMLDQVLDIFEIKPDYDLNIMKQGQDLYDITSGVILGMRDVLDKVNPDIVFVHGDTSTSTITALASFYKQIPVAHIEAGLRTNDLYSPWPEEANRQITGRLSTYHFAPTTLAKNNLLKENIKEENIFITGNTVIDALYMVLDKIKSDKSLVEKLKKQIREKGYSISDELRVKSNELRVKSNELSVKSKGLRVKSELPSPPITHHSSLITNHPSPPITHHSSLITNHPSPITHHSSLILVTGHRRENHGQGFINICNALKEIAEKYPNFDIVYPVHLNPNVRKTVREILGNIVSSKELRVTSNELRVKSDKLSENDSSPITHHSSLNSNIYLIQPLEYLQFVYLMSKSYLVLTDSGGIQEEAPGLGKPVLVMRNTTERPEALEAGTVKLVGTDKSLIVSEVSKLIDDKEYYKTMSQANNPYGDGKASERIVKNISIK